MPTTQHYIKPWRPYWERLDTMAEALLKGAGPPPFRYADKAAEWIGKLTWLELSACDQDFKLWIENPLLHTDPAPHQGVHGAALRWQMILRAECATDFCRGHCWNRREFDWTQTEAAIYRWLLIDLWRSDACYWASKRLGDQRDFQALSTIRGDLFALCPPQRPDIN